MMVSYTFAPKCCCRSSEIGLRALASRIELDRWLAVARRLGEADVARNDGLVHLRAEMLLQIVRDLLGERVARVEHRPHQAVDLDAGVEMRTHLLDGVD